jgi:Mor family transcriptional regulator
MIENLDVTLDDLLDSQKELAELIGLDNYIKLVHYYGGGSAYFQAPSKLIKPARNRAIIEAADGYNAKELARQHGISLRQAYNIIPREIRIKRKNKPMDGQIRLF